MAMEELPERVLKTRLDVFDEIGPEDSHPLIYDGYRSMALTLTRSKAWSKKGLILEATREEVLLFTINGDLIIHTPEIATASLRFFDQAQWRAGFALGRDRSIGAANVILAHFMFDNVDETPGMVINGLRACLQRSIGSELILPA